MARIVGQATSGLAPKLVMMTPVEAVRKVAQKIGWDLKDVDLFEINEAFSVQAVAVMRELGIDPARVNVHGGAVALGHPIGASGARVLTTLLYAMKRRNAPPRHRRAVPRRRQWRALAVEQRIRNRTAYRGLQTSRQCVRRGHDGQRHRPGVHAGRVRRAAGRCGSRLRSTARARTIEKSLGKFVEKGRMTADDRDATLARLSTGTERRRARRRRLRRRGHRRERRGQARALRTARCADAAGRHPLVEHVVDLDHAARRRDRAVPTRCSACTS